MLRDDALDVALEHRTRAALAAAQANSTWTAAETKAADAGARAATPAQRHTAAAARREALRARAQLEKAEAVHHAIAHLVQDMLGPTSSGV